MPKNKLYLPVEFWTYVLSALDSKVELLSTNSGFGEVKLTLKIHRGTVTEVYFSDELRARGILEHVSSESKTEEKLDNKE